MLIHIALLAMGLFFKSIFVEVMLATIHLAPGAWFVGDFEVGLSACCQ